MLFEQNLIFLYKTITAIHGINWKITLVEIMKSCWTVVYMAMPGMQGYEKWEHRKWYFQSMVKFWNVVISNLKKINEFAKILCLLPPFSCQNRLLNRFQPQPYLISHFEQEIEKKWPTSFHVNVTHTVTQNTYTFIRLLQILPGHRSVRNYRHLEQENI